MSVWSGSCLNDQIAEDRRGSSRRAQVRPAPPPPPPPPVRPLYSLKAGLLALALSFGCFGCDDDLRSGGTRVSLHKTLTVRRVGPLTVRRPCRRQTPGRSGTGCCSRRRSWLRRARVVLISTAAFRRQLRVPFAEPSVCPWLVMEVQQLNELRRAVRDLQHRGLLHSARWAAEHVVALHEVRSLCAAMACDTSHAREPHAPGVTPCRCWATT